MCEEKTQILSESFWSFLLEPRIKEYMVLLNKCPKITLFEGNSNRQKRTIELSKQKDLRCNEIHSLCEALRNSNKIIIKENGQKLIFEKVMG